MTITLKYTDGKQIGRRFKTKVKVFDESRILAVQAAAKRASEEMVDEGRADIRAGGNFGSARWQDGLEARVSYESRQDINIRITHAVFYWRVFEEGAVIHGKPLLWIPLSFGDSDGVRARDYPGQLFRVDRAGKAPLLMSDSGPQYFGKESVTIPKKWHLRDVVAKVSRRLGRYYREAFRNG